jgi:hypothetical protein
MSQLFLRKLSYRGVIALLALVAITAFGDTTVTLNSGTSISVDTGSTNTSGTGDMTWTGGQFTFIGSATGTDLTGAASGSYTCIANQSALQFMVPGFVTSTLPAGTGTMTVSDYASYATFTAAGFDLGTGFGSNSIQINSTYQ